MKSIILIPESEGKTQGGTHPPLKQINPITKLLIQQINQTKDQEKLLGIKGKKLQDAININKQISTANTLPAIERFIGVVYGALDAKSLTNTRNIFIATSLFGVINAQTLIPDYKLKISKLQADKLWLEHNTTILKNYFVIDLLPQAHRKSIRYQNGIQVNFTIIKNNKKMPAGHNGKFIKGKFARWLIQNNITDPKLMCKFDDDNFKGKIANNTIEFTKQNN